MWRCRRKPVRGRQVASDHGVHHDGFTTGGTDCAVDPVKVSDAGQRGNVDLDLMRFRKSSNQICIFLHISGIFEEPVDKKRRSGLAGSGCGDKWECESCSRKKNSSMFQTGVWHEQDEIFMAMGRTSGL